MKKRKIFLGIITAAIAVCLVLCVYMSACTVKIEIDATDNTEHEHKFDVLNYDVDYHWYECSCGVVSPDNPVPHSSESGYKYNDVSHWKVCDVCKQNFGTESHDVTSGACICGYETEVHTHDYSELKSDETGHWYECACGDKKDFEQHSSTNGDGTTAYDSDGTQHWEICAVCGYVTGEKTGHSTVETSYQSDGNNHWHTCDVCGGEMDKGAHDTNGVDGACSICGYVKTELAETTVYMVGDSTMCSFNDDYYYPRYGYGTQVPNYLDEKAAVVNLAKSGRSSKSFLTESEYTTLTSSISAGDYLIIGFGHNDESDDDDTRYTSPELDAVDQEGSFQNTLYNYYIKVATDVGATPILCTPIVRANTSDNYNGSSGHITDKGDYPACIKDLADDQGITCIDLTALTKEKYLAIGYNEAIYYHAWKSSDPSSVDKTHLNIYGAKEVAYMLATELKKSTCLLGDYVLDGITEPTKEKDLDYNHDFQEPEGDNDFTGSTWSQYSLGTYLDVDWYKTAFGSIGSDSPYGSSGGYLGSLDATNGKITVGQTATTARGTVGSTTDGLSYVFTPLDGYRQFKIVATATITSANNTATSSTNTGTAVAQEGFGIMLRDDIYVPTRSDLINTNYVASGMNITSTNNGTVVSNHIIFSKVKETLVNSDEEESKNKLSSAYSVGETMTITLERTGKAQTTNCAIAYNNVEYTYTYYDFDYESADYEYSYLCFFACRGTVVEFTNITLELGEIGQA